MNDDSAGTVPDGTDPIVHAALHALQDCFVLVGADGTLLSWNEALCVATGYADDDLAERVFPDLFAADGDVERAVATALESGDATLTVDLLDGDGDPVPYEFELVRVPVDAGDDRVAGIGRDVTDWEAAARDREAIIDRMTDAFFALDEDWRLTYVNDEAQSILAAAMGEAYTAEEMVGMALWEAVPEAVGTPFYEGYHRAMADQETVHVDEYYEPLDTWFSVTAHPSDSGLSVHLQDITERKRDRLMLERREAALREIYEVTADPDLAFEEQVSTLLELGADLLDTAYGTLSHIEGEDYVFEVVHTTDDDIEAGDVVPLSTTNCERAATTEETLVLEHVAEDAPDLAERAGNEEWGIACYLGAPVLVDGEVYGTFCFYDMEPRSEAFTAWEVTLVDLMSQWVSYELERTQAHDRLERKNAQLEQFASIVSHDLRNPLNVLTASLDIAQETGDVTHFERCHRAVERMEALIDDMLTLARAGDRIDAVQPVSLPAVVEECWNAVETGPASLSVHTERSIEADRERLRQLFENLVRNAVEHGGESVTVTVGDLDDGFYLEDDGPGIPEAERDDVFDAGYSTADQGTGFGLNIVSQVVDAHGWTVRVVEGAGGGARFEVTGVESVT